MEKEIMNLNSSAPARDIAIVTREIKELCQQAQRMALAYVIEIGRRLVEAKSVLPHGEWEGWLKSEVNFSQSTANNYMKLYAEYGDTQISLFGAVVNSQALGNLPYSKALALLSVPSDEREDFAEKVDAESISLRELQAVIKERDNAIAEAAENKKRTSELEQAVAHAEIARDAALRQAEETDELRTAIAELEEKLETAKGAEDKLKAKLKAAKDNPKLSPEKMNEIEREAERNVTAKLEKQLEELRSAVSEAEHRERIAAHKLTEAEEKLAAAERAMKTASPAVSEFKAIFDQLQKMAASAKNKLREVATNDPEVADKLRAALSALGDSLKNNV